MVNTGRARPKSISLYPIDEEIIRAIRDKQMLSTDSEVIQWVLRRQVRDGEIQLAQQGDQSSADGGGRITGKK